MCMTTQDLKHGLDILKKKGIQHFFDHLLKKIGFRDELLEDKKKYNYYKSLDSADYESELKKWYFEKTGKELDLENPKTFNEKLQWLKLYDSTNIKTKLSDKYLVREWFKQQIGEQYLVPLLGVWNKFDDIDFDKLPNQFALKANHGSGWNLIVKDKKRLNHKKAKNDFDKWMQLDFSLIGGFELHYRNIEPKIIAEKFLKNADGLIDYRFYCFNGEPKQVWVDIHSGTPNHKREIYDISWKKIPMRCTWPTANGLLDNKPKKYKEMLEISKKLSKNFSFVRVDFYEVDKVLYMGEMTFIPMSGIGLIEPLEMDLLMGKMLDLPLKNDFSRIV